MKPTIAIIGASADRTKYSNKSLLAHQRAGYEIYPINPKEEVIEGLKCYPSILDVPVAVNALAYMFHQRSA